MKLLNLSIQGFGKFRHFDLDLSEGLNVIYGLNEAGKSTLHAFIEGMFYGFIDGTKKKRSFLPEHAKYAPRDTTAYQGSLTFIKGGTRYRIERNFDKKKGFVKLYNALTGKDLTEDFPTHPVRREIDLAKFLDMPHTLFKNTLSIAQLSAETNEEAGSELLRRLQNTKETQSETLSMSRAIETLDKRIASIGTERARTRPYAQALNKLDEINRELDQAKTIHEETLEEKQRLDALREEDAHLKSEKSSLEKSLKALENTKRLTTYQSIEAKLSALQKTLEASANAPELTVKSLVELTQAHPEAFDRLDPLKDDLFDKLSKLESVETRLEGLESGVEKTPFNQIKDDYERLENLRQKQKESEARIQVLEGEKKEAEETFEASRDVLHKRVHTFTHLWPFMTMLFIAASLAGYFVFDWAWAFFLLVVPPVVGVILFKRNRAQARKATQDLNAFDEAESALKKEKASLGIASDSIQKLIGRYALEKDSDFEPLFYQAKNALQDQTYKKTLYEAIEAILENYDPLLKTLGLPRDLAKLRASFNALQSVKTTAKEIQSLLGGTPFNAFKATIDFDSDTVDPSRERDILEALEDIRDTLQAHALERSRKEEAIANKESRIRDIPTIHYELNETRKLIHEYDKEKRILQKAIERLKKVQKDIEEHFAPIMNEHTQKYLSILTNEHYDSIKVKKDLTFSALATTTGQLEEADFFSKGTLDQIYIAMRLGILETLGKTDYPFFLDDAFTQFDEARLDSALAMLNTMATNRQVILFTCHAREQAALETKNIPFTGHTLK